MNVGVRVVKLNNAGLNHELGLSEKIILGKFTFLL
jgi:hypothetical protein